MKKLILVLTLLIATAAPVAAQSPIDLANKVQADLTALIVSLTPTSGSVVNVPAGGDLQAALNAAKPGDTIRLTAGATYTGNFILPVKTCSAGLQACGVITVTTTGTLPVRRIGPADAAGMPKLQASAGGAAALATAPGAHHWTLVGIEWRPNPGGFGDLLQLGDGSNAQNTLASVPHDLVVDRCYLHGDPVIGQKRGIALNSAATTITNSYISDIKLAGQDTQAIAGWNGPGPFSILNNYLEASGENILFGGSDPAIANLVPSDISITGNTIFKPVGWQAQNWQVKNLFELKNARRVLFEHNVVGNVWGPKQGGFAFQLTVRNQDGGCPWCTVEDVTIRSNTVTGTAAAVNMLGADDGHPSQRMARISVTANTFDVDPQVWTGTAKIFQLLAGPVDVSIDGNTITGAHLIGKDSSALYFDGAPKALRLTFTNNHLPATDYGIFGGGSSAGGTPPHAWIDFVDSGTLSGNVVTP